MLALYHFGPVANSLTPLLALLEKGLAFDNRVLDSRKWEHHDPAFRAINPDGIVPVLVHDGRVVRESTVINEYLEDVFPQPALRPANPWLRAEMRVLTKYVDEYFCPALTTIGAHGATPFASKIDKSEMAARLANMPNEEVRRKWATVSETGYSDEELADARLVGQEADHAADERPVVADDPADVGQGGEQLLRGLAVGGEVVLAAEDVVVDPGDVGHGCIDAGRPRAVSAQLRVTASPCERC